MMKSILLVIFGIVGVFSAKYPADLPRCNFGDTECIRDTINLYVKTLKEGKRELNLVSIDPLYVNEVDIIQGGQSPVNVNLNFKNVSFFGLSDLLVKKVVGFDKDPKTSKFEIYADVKQLSLIGQYKIKGNVILLPIVGNGPANLTFDNIDISLKFVPKVNVKKDKEYLQFSDVKLDFTTTQMHIQLSNLFNGDQLLSDTTNKFLNENWSDILNELKPVLKTAIGNIANGVIGPVFNKFPYEQLFL